MIGLLVALVFFSCLVIERSLPEPLYVTNVVYMESNCRIGYFQKYESTGEYIIYRSFDGKHKTIYNKKTHHITRVDTAEDRRLLRKENDEEKDDVSQV